VIKFEDSRRLVIVLPLYTNHESVLSWPFVVDPGAPRMLYLGAVSLHQLDAIFPAHVQCRL